MALKPAALPGACVNDEDRKGQICKESRRAAVKESGGQPKFAALSQ